MRENCEKISRMNSSSDFNSGAPISALRRTPSCATNGSSGETRQRSVDEQLSLLKGQPMSELMLYPIQVVQDVVRAGVKPKWPRVTPNCDLTLTSRFSTLVQSLTRVTAPSNIKVNGLRFVGWPMATPPTQTSDAYANDRRHVADFQLSAFNLVFVIRATCNQSIGNR